MKIYVHKAQRMIVHTDQLAYLKNVCNHLCSFHLYFCLINPPILNYADFVWTFETKSRTGLTGSPTMNGGFELVSVHLIDDSSPW